MKKIILTTLFTLGFIGIAHAATPPALNALLYWNGSNFSSTSSPTVGYITATSTTATSTFANAVGIGTSLPSIWSNLIYTNCSGTYPASVTTGGCFHIDSPVGNLGPAFEVNVSAGASASGRGIVFNQTNSADVQDFIVASSSATNTTDLNLKGFPTGKGVLKIEHTGGGTGFSNASAISIDNTSGDAQGIFIKIGTGIPINVQSSGSATLFKVDNLGNSTTTGFIDVNGTGTSTFAGGVVFPQIRTTATSTLGAGFNITAGCFAVNNVCVSGSGGGSGTVTSVNMSVPTGLSISGNPVTTSGTLALTLTSGFNIPLTASTTQWSSLYLGSTTLPYVTSVSGNNGLTGTVTTSGNIGLDLTNLSPLTMVGWDGTRLTSSSTPTANAFTATSTTATSTFMGNVSIGTTTVIGAGLTVQGVGATDNKIKITNGTSIYSIGFNAAGAQSAVNGTLSNNSFTFQTNSTSRAIITGGGLFGFGTTTSSALPANFTVWGSGTGATTAFSIVNSASSTGFSVLDNGSVIIPGLATAAGTFIAADPNGKLIATTTSAGGVTSVTGTGEITSTGGNTPAISYSGISTSSVLTVSGIVYATDSIRKVATVATSSLGVTGPITFSGTLGAQVGGVGGNFDCTTAASGVAGCLSNTAFDTFNNKQDALSGGAVNLMTYWTSASAIAATGSPTVGIIVATSTTATSTFSGGVTLGGSTSVYKGGDMVIGTGGAAFTNRGLQINPASNGMATLQLLSTGGAGAIIGFGSSNAITGVMGYAGSYSSTFEMNSGTAFSARTDLFDVNTLGMGTFGTIGNTLAATNLSLSTTTGGSISSNTTQFYIVEPVDYAGNERPQQGVNQSSVAMGAAGTRAVVTWTAIPGAAYYKIYRSTTSGTYSTPALIASTTGTTYSDGASTAQTGAPPQNVYQGWGNILSQNGQSFIGTGGLNIMADNDGVVNLFTVASTTATSSPGLATTTLFQVNSGGAVSIGTTTTSGIFNVSGSSAGSSTKGVCHQEKAVGANSYIYYWYDSSAVQHVQTASCSGAGTTTVIIE